ncbi:MAG: M23 family metallopeptidase [Polyangiaceae bacterium]
MLGVFVLLDLGCGDSDTSGGGGSGASTSSSGAAGVGGSTGGVGGSSTNGGAPAGGSGGALPVGGSGGSVNPPDDPCFGASDGDHCGTELGGLADHASLYSCAGGATSSVTPCPAGCENSACTTPAADPCASAQFGNGAYCGGSLLGGDAQRLYHCANGVTSSTELCTAGCQVQPPGTPDSCKPTGDPCVNASSGNGAYCGASLGSGDPNTLYDCQNGSTASSTTCPNGCQVMPPGVADACAPASSECCVNEPPGALTQAYSACGGGGSHYGRDYGTAIGTPIYAGISGTVVGSALGFPNCYNNGCSQQCWNSFNYVKVKSDCGDPNDPSHDFYVYYLHIDSLPPGISNGVHVDQGELLAYSGNSGCSSGPHIHIETVSVAQGANASLSTCNSVDPASRYCP